jgi:dTDP-4-dehydrorhamnose reductase
MANFPGSLISRVPSERIVETDRPFHALVFGTTGQLARALGDAAGRCTRVALTAVPRTEADFRYPQQVRDAVARARDFDIVINAVAYTAVDKAESEEDVALAVNATSVEVLAQACRARDLPLIHVSTDYVFDGTKSTAYREDDPVAPLNAYGRTKLAGENAIRATLERHAIVRTSWVYSAHGANFVKTMLRLGRERTQLRVVDDQWGSPTSAQSLAAALLAMAGRIMRSGPRELFGTFHYIDRGETTWSRFAVEIFRLAGLDVHVDPIATADYPTPARRPLNSRLDCAKIEAVYGIVRPRWQDSLSQVRKTLHAEGLMS